MHELLTKKLWENFILLCRPNIGEYKRHMNLFRKQRIIEVLQENAALARENNRKALQFREVWLRRKARRMIEGFKQEYFKATRLEQKLLDYKVSYCGQFWDRWRSEFKRK